MRHLSDIDAQLGLAPYDNFSDADGKGAAKAALAAGIAACGLKHPFSKSKRKACADEKKRIYAAKIAAIDSVKNPVAPEETEKVTEIAEKLPAKSLAQSTMPESPAAARVVEQAKQEAAAAAAAAEAEGGMSMNTKILIGVGAAVLLIGGYMYMKRKK